MSWDIDIVDEDGYTMKCEKEHKMIGGTVRCDENLKQIPVTDATLNITYNYGKLYNLVWEHTIDWFDGKDANDPIVIDKLKLGIEKLGTFPHQDYWACTPGNAGKALENILFLCEQCPSGKIRVW